MLKQMSSAEFTQWAAYFSIEPMPDQRADRRAAEIKQAILAAGGIKRVPRLMDLVPDWWDAFHVKQTPETMQANLMLSLPRKKKSNGA